MGSEKSDIERCLRQIEAQLGWGAAEGWTNRDYENLAEEIFTHTQVRLSVTTLKRLWGRISYNSQPTASTLDTLARFRGSPTWREFRKTLNQDIADESRQEKKLSQPIIEKSPLLTYLAALFLIAILAGITYYIRPPQLKGTEGSYQFSSTKTVSEGVPNSVVFDYDASSSPFDSVYIQQSWDARRRTRVPKNGGKHTSIYYYPGYFRAKLVVGEQIMKEHDLFITSEGWVAAIDRKPVPAYLKPEEFNTNGIVEVLPEQIAALGISMQPDLPLLRIYRVEEMNGLKTDDFEFETSVKSNFNEGSGVCERIEVLILCKNDAMIVPLVSKRCTGNIGLSAAGKFISSSDNDLSGFGTALSDWTTLKIVSRKQKIQFIVNNRQAFELPFEQPASEIVGLQFRFEGAGSVGKTFFKCQDTVFKF